MTYQYTNVNNENNSVGLITFVAEELRHRTIDLEGPSSSRGSEFE